MTAGKQRGKNVRVPFSVPITFKMESKLQVIDEKMEMNDELGTPFITVEEAPIYPGCENASDKRACFQESIYKHISKNFRYPQEAQDLGIQGKVNTMFVIGKDGSINDIRLKGPSKLLEEETKRILLLLPNMKPGKQKGKEVNVPFSVPITFKLQSEKEFELIPESIALKYPKLKEKIKEFNILINDRILQLNATKIDKDKLNQLEVKIRNKQNELNKELEKELR